MRGLITLGSIAPTKIKVQLKIVFLYVRKVKRKKGKQKQNMEKKKEREAWKVSCCSMVVCRFCVHKPIISS